MRNKIAILILAGLALISISDGVRAHHGGPPSTYNVTEIFSKAEIEGIVGGQLLDAAIDSSNLGSVRYYEIGSPYLEALRFSVRRIDTLEYFGLVDMAKKVGEYKSEIQDLGDKAFWQENISFGSLTVLKGNILIVVMVSRSVPPRTKLDAAKELMKLALLRLKEQ
jgi:hypothetical protein